MSKGRDEIIQIVAGEIAAFCNSRQWTDRGLLIKERGGVYRDEDLLDTADKVSKTQTPTHRLAIVRKKAEYTQNPYFISDIEKAGFVQEEKD